MKENMAERPGSIRPARAGRITGAMRYFSIEMKREG
jgi:hypothetical protein